MTTSVTSKLARAATTTPMPPRRPLDPAVTAWLREVGSKGGSRRSDAQQAVTQRMAEALRRRREAGEGSLASRARKAGLKRSTVAMRLRAGWTMAEALGTAVRNGKR